MTGKVHVVCVVLAVLTIGQTLAEVDPADMCRTSTASIPVDLVKLASLGRWKTLYATDSEFMRSLDHATVDTTTVDNKTFTAVETYVSKDNKTRISSSSTIKYKHDVIYELRKDDQGYERRYAIRVLAAIDEVDAYLFYRCRLLGNLNQNTTYLDARYIAVPKDRKVSEEQINELLHVDQHYRFKGNLYKLPNKYI